MTFMIILGTIAGLYLIMLLFRLAAIALPLYAGIGSAFWLLDRGHGPVTAITAGLLFGAFILLAGRLLCATLPPLYRAIVAIIFAVPAGFAGYQAAKGLAGLALSEGVWLELLGFAGALTAAVAVWRSLGTPQAQDPVSDAPLGAASEA